MFEKSLKLLESGLDVVDVKLGGVDHFCNHEQDGRSCFEYLCHGGLVEADDRSRCAEVLLSFCEDVCVGKFALPVKTPFVFCCKVCGKDVV